MSSGIDQGNQVNDETASSSGVGGSSERQSSAVDSSRASFASPTEEVQKSGQEMSALQRSGVDLAKWVLSIIAVALIVLTLLVASSEIWPISDVTEVHQLVLEIQTKASALKPEDPSLAQARTDLLELTRQIVEAKQAQRAFWIQFSQMILLNLLLPVLTAILGYVFGANSNKS